MDQVEEYHQECAKTNFSPIPLQNLPSNLLMTVVNKLILRNSADTAMVLTALPFPMPPSSEESVAQAYVDRLNTLVRGLPPTILAANGEDVAFISTSL
jgi:hypothetical protein